MNTPKVSIIIPVYNSEKYLAECLESIRNQTFQEFEAIIVDDGSTDRSSEVYKNMTYIDPRFVSIRQSNSGVNAARKAGLKKSVGEYIAFIDSDDRIDVKYIETLYNLVQIEHIKISSCKYYTGNGKNTHSNVKCKLLSPIEAMESMIKDKDYSASLWGKMFHKSILNDIDFPELSIGEDLVVNAMALSKIKNVSYCNSELYFYRESINSLTNSKFSKRQMDYFESNIHLLRIVDKYFPDLHDIAIQRFVRYSVGYLFRAIKNGYTDYTDIKKMRDIIKTHLFIFLKSDYKIKYKILALWLLVF